MLEAGRLNDDAVRLQAQGSYQQALSAFLRANELYQEIGDKMSEGRCTNGVGALCKDLGRYDEAKRWLEAALKLRQETEDQRGEALTLITLGPVYLKLGQSEAARQSLANASQLAENIGDQVLEGQAFFNLGIVCNETGNLMESLDWFQRSLALAIEQCNPYEENKCLNSLGITCKGLGRFDQSIRYFKKSIELSRKFNNQLGESAGLENLASLYWVLGRHEESMRLLTESLTITMQTGSPELALTAANSYGMILLEEYNDIGKANKYFEFALDIARKNGNNPAAAESLRLLGRVCQKIGETEKAVELLNESRNLCHEGGNLAGEASTLSVISSLEASLGRYQEATVNAEKSLFISRSIGDEFEEAIGLYNLGAIHDTEGRSEKALELFESALSIFDRLRYNVSGDMLRTSFFDSWKVQNIYYVYVSRLVQKYIDTSKKTFAEKAFLVSERRRARALLDVVGEGHTDANQVTFWGVSEVQTHLLDHRTLLLEYSLHDNKSYLFAVGKETFEIYVMPGAADIQELVLDLRQLIKKGSVDDVIAKSSELYRILVGPVGSNLRGKKLLIVPDGSLYYLPFQMLISNNSSHSPLASGKKAKPVAARPRFFWSKQSRKCVGYKDLPFLVKQNTIVYVPSISILAALNDREQAFRESPESICFDGFAPVYSAVVTGGDHKFNALPGTKTEIENIANLFSSNSATIYFDKAATKRAVIAEIPASRGYIHFATHGLVDFADPRYSALLFHPEQTEDYFLYVSDVMDLKLDAELVVLSACETGLGKTLLGEGVIGLSRAFLYAGARSVCASLWVVADKGTAELMYRFYRNLLQGEMEHAEALQAAQIELLETDGYSSPYYWAPFILIGG